MAFGMRRLSRLILCSARFSFAALLLAGVSAAAPQPPVVPPAGPQFKDTVTYHEVRLRKLHLVRPDLIPYPVAYDIYC